MSNKSITVLRESYEHAFRIQSDFAREFAQDVAALACLGLITTLVTPGVYGRRWRVTATGLDALKESGLL